MTHNCIYGRSKLRPTIVILDGSKLQPPVVIVDDPKLGPTTGILDCQNYCSTKFMVVECKYGRPFLLSTSLILDDSKSLPTFKILDGYIYLGNLEFVPMDRFIP